MNATTATSHRVTISRDNGTATATCAACDFTASGTNDRHIDQAAIGHVQSENERAYFASDEWKARREAMFGPRTTTPTPSFRDTAWDAEDDSLIEPREARALDADEYTAYWGDDA